MKKTLVILLSFVLVAAMVFTVACNNHTWAEDWSDDKDNHWHACLDEGCEEKNDVAPHVDDNKDNECDMCKRKLSTTPEPPIGGDDSDVVTLYFYNVEGWQDVYAYAYNDADEKLLGEWPGTKTTAVNDHEGWVKIDVEANPVTDAFNIIFNNNSSQTTDLVIDDVTNVYLLDRANGTFDSFEAAEKAFNEKPIAKETIIINYHKNAVWGDTVKAYVYSNNGLGELLGGWGSYTATVASDGWYTISVSIDEGKLVDGKTFNLIVFDSETDTLRVELVVDSNAERFVASDGQAFDSKEAVEEYESAPKTEYTINYYAPEWPEGETVYIYTYGGTLGSIGGWNSTIMTAVDGKADWYSVSFETSLEVTSFSVIFNTEDESIKHEFEASELTGESFYFVSNGNDKYADYAAAEAGYLHNKELAESQPVSVTLNMYAPDWTTVKVHTWGAYVTGVWGTVSMAADADNEGWYTYTFECPQAALEETGVDIICFNGDKDSERITVKIIDTSKLFFSAEKGDKTYATREDALAAEENPNPNPDPDENEYTLYLYAPNVTTEAVTVSVWGNFAGAFNDNSAMTADADNTGWFKFTFTTDKELSESLGINLNFYIDGTFAVGGYTTDANWVYFIANKTDVKYGSMADAEAAYEEYANPEVPTDMTEYTLYLYAPEWETVKLHTWNAYATGAWGSASMSAVAENEGWYSYTFECSKAAFEEKGINIIFFDSANDDEAGGNPVRVSTYTKDGAWVYFNVAKGDKAFASMADAVAAE